MSGPVVSLTFRQFLQQVFQAEVDQRIARGDTEVERPDPWAADTSNGICAHHGATFDAAVLVQNRGIEP